MNSNIVTNELSDDVRLQIGEGEDEIRVERKNLRNIRGDECRDTRLFAPDLRRPHGITRNAGNTVLLAEEIEGLDCFFGQADDSLRRKHTLSKHIDLCCVEQFDAASRYYRSTFEAHDSSGDASYFGGIVADVNERHTRFVTQAFQVGQYFTLASGIQ